MHFPFSNGILFILLLFISACTPETSETKQPNIIILFCDDMGYGDMGNTGHTTILTPNLDRLAMDGLRFTNFYSGSPACTASRYALLTGKYPRRSGFAWVLGPKSPRGIHPKETTLAEYLKTKDYATACYGKWHLGFGKEEYMPLKNGFDDYIGFPYSNDMIPPKWPDIPLLEGKDTVELNPDQSGMTELFTNRALSFIDKNKEKPFFLYVPYSMPHVPLYPGEAFKGKSQRGLYGDVIEEIDWSVGEIRKRVEELGLAENTLIFFTSDNGPWIIKDEKGGSSGLLRDGKGSTWEGGIHVPGIAYWKGTIPAASVSREMATTLDLFPTILQLTNGEKGEGQILDGESFHLRWTEQLSQKGHEAYFYYGLNNEVLAVRQGPWKLHVKTYSQTGKKYFEKEPPLLFNLDIDPSEQYELSEEHPERVERLAELVKAHQNRIEAEGNYFDN